MWPVPVDPTAYVPVVAVALFFYDYVLTVPQELNLFWRGGLTGAAVLFLSNRYLHVLHYILVDAVTVNTDSSCNMLERATWAMTTLVYVPWAAFSAMRTYALCQAWTIAVFVFVLSMMPAFANIAQAVMGVYGILLPDEGCVTSLNFPNDNVPLNLTILSRSCVIGADAIVLAVTWRRLYRQGALSWHSLVAPHLSLAQLLLRDGTLYFLILLILNLLHVLFTTDIIHDPSGSVFSFILSLIDTLTTIFVSHLLIDLQQANRRSARIALRQPGSETLGRADSGGAGTFSTDSRGLAAESIVFAKVMDSFEESFVIGDSEGVSFEGASGEDGDLDEADGVEEGLEGDCDGPIVINSAGRVLPEAYELTPMGEK